MKSPEKKEIVKRILVVLLFVLFGFCVPECAASKDTAPTERKAS